MKKNLLIILLASLLYPFTTSPQDRDGDYWNKRGQEYDRAGEYEKAGECFENALRIFREEEDYGGMAKAYNNLGNLEHYQNRHKEALPFYQKAIELAEKGGSRRIVAVASNNLGGLFSALKQYDQSLEYYNKAVDSFIALGDTLNLATSLLGKGDVLFLLEENERGRKNSRLALEYARQTGNVLAQCVASMNIAHYHQVVEQYDSCLVYAERSYELALETGHPYYQGSALNALAYAYYYNKNYKTAEQYARDAIRQNRETGHKRKLADAYQVLSDIYLATGRPAESLEAYKEAVVYKDSLVNEENLKEIQTLEARFQSAQKDKSLVQKQLVIERRNKQLGFAIAGILALACLLWLLYRNYRQKQRLQEQKLMNLKKENQIRDLRTTMQGEEKERTRIAGELHDGIGGQLAALKMKLSSVESGYLPENREHDFSEATRILDEIVREVRLSAHNLMPEILTRAGLVEALRKFCQTVQTGGSLKIHFQAHGDFPRLPDSFSLPVYRMVQELVQNIVRHAGASEAIVQLSVHEELLSVTVEDNGRGFDPPGKAKSAGGVGLSNLQARAKALGGNMDIESTPGEGTTVTLEFDLSSYLADATH